MLAQRTGRPFADSDEWIESRYGDTGAQIAERDGVPALHAIELEAFVHMTGADASVVAPAESVVDDPAGRALLEDHITIWLDADVSELGRRRASGTHRRSMLPDEFESRRLARREHLDACADVRIDTTHLHASNVVGRIEELLATR